MRIFPVWPIVAAMAMTLFPSAAPAQTSIDACYPPAAIRALSPERHAGVNLSESDRTVKIAQIREALAQSPDDLFLNRWIVLDYENSSHGSYRTHRISRSGCA